VPVEVRIEYTGDADEADVRLAAETYARSVGIGGRFSIRDLYAAFNPLDLETVEVVSPERDAQAGDGGIITATVTAVKAAE
jgi:hypothetical protein